MSRLPLIGELEKKPGEDWTPAERNSFREWLISEKWDDLSRIVKRYIHESPADHRAGVMAAFLDDQLERILEGYKDGFNGIWPYVVVSLLRYCWKEASTLTRECSLTKTIGDDEGAWESLDKASPAVGDLPAWVQYRDLRALLQRELALLNPEYREPLLRRIRGATYKEIAEELGVSLQLVKIRIFRGRERLRKALKAAWPGL